MSRLKRAVSLLKLSQKAQEDGLPDMAAELLRRSRAVSYRIQNPDRYVRPWQYNCVCCGYPVPGDDVPPFETYCQCPEW